MTTAIIIYLIGVGEAYLLFWNKFLLNFDKKKYNMKKICYLSLLFGVLSWFSVAIFIIDEIIEFVKIIKKH